MELIESTFDIRKALGDAYTSIKIFDPKDREREEAQRLIPELLKFSDRCASCGIVPNQRSRYWAHIEPVDEGGKSTICNIVLLCGPCHSLFDTGHASRVEMRESAACWRQGKIKPLDSIMKSRQVAVLRDGAGRVGRRPKRIPGESSLNRPINLGRGPKALAGIANINRASLDESTAEVLKVLEAVAYRRRAARGSVLVAQGILQTVIPEKLGAHQSWFFYERGYVAKLLGDHQFAIDSFRMSRSAAELLRDEFAPGEAFRADRAAMAIRIIAFDPEAPSIEVSDMLTRFEQLEKRAKEVFTRDSDANNEIQNLKNQRAHFLVKCRDYLGAIEVSGRLRDLRDSADITSGWGALDKLDVVILKGYLYLGAPTSKLDIETGLGLLARAIVPVLGGSRQRPEGMRDTLLWFEKVLAALNNRQNAEHARRLKEVRQQTMDGSSWFDAYRLTTRLGGS